MTRSSQILARNSLANLIGQLIYPLLSFALVPLYISRLGLEGYGLVGFFTSVVMLLGLFTKGLSTAMNREIARRSATDTGRTTLRSFMRTFEISYTLVGVVVGVALAAAATFLSENWVNVSEIPTTTVRLCLVIIAFRIALSFPTTVYYSSLNGTQDQIPLNVIASSFAVWTAVCGAVIVVLTRSIIAFYLGELINATLATATVRWYSQRRLPAPPGPASFSRAELLGLLRESLGLMWANSVGGLITQLDRVVISRLMSATYLGAYVAATAAGRLLGMVYGPFLQASYPQMCQLVVEDRGQQAQAVVLRNVRIIAIACLSVAAPLSTFSSDILLTWTRNEFIASRGAAVMSIYLLGNVCIGFSSVLYQVQMATGRLRAAVWFNGVALIWFPALLWVAVSRAGLVGAAWVWLVYCSVGWIFNVLVTGRLLSARRWLIAYAWSLTPIVAVTIAVTAAGRLLADQLASGQPAVRTLFAVATGGIVLLGGSLVTYGRRLPNELRQLLRRP